MKIRMGLDEIIHFEIIQNCKSLDGWRTLCFKEHFTQKEHFASQELNTLRSPTHLTKSQFTSQHTLLLNTLCYSEPFTPHYTLLLSTLCSSEHFAPQHTLLQRTLYSSTHFTPQHTLLLNTFCSLEHFAPQHIMLLGIHLTIMWNRCMKQDSDLNFRVKMSKKIVLGM